MKRKFKALQIGGNDLETLFDSNKKVEWDYFAPAIMQYEENYLDAVRNIIDEHGQFDFVFVQARYSEQLIEMLALVGTPYNTYIDDTYWDTQYEQDNTISELLARPLSYQSEADLHEKLKAVTFQGNMGINCIRNTVLSVKHLMATLDLWGTNISYCLEISEPS